MRLRNTTTQKPGKRHAVSRAARPGGNIAKWRRTLVANPPRKVHRAGELRSGHQRAACPIDPAARKGGAASALSSPLLHSTRPALHPPFPRACRPHDDCSGELGQTRVRFPLGRKHTTIRHSTTSATSSARNLPYGRARRSSLCSCRPRAAFGDLRGRRRLGARAVDAAARERRVSSSALGPRRRPSLLHRALLPAVARCGAQRVRARRPARRVVSQQRGGLGR